MSTIGGRLNVSADPEAGEGNKALDYWPWRLNIQRSHPTRRCASGSMSEYKSCSGSFELWAGRRVGGRASIVGGGMVEVITLNCKESK